MTRPQTLIDKFGNRHTEAVLRHWHPKVIKALGVRRENEPEATEEKKETKK